MMDRPRDSVRGEYARLASTFDRRWERYNRRSLEMLRPHLATGPMGTVLDLACGTANLASRLAEWSASVDRYLGADLSPEMLRAAQPRVAHAPFPAALFVADGAALPLRTGSIDTVVTASALHDWPDAAAVLGEARRVLRPGGRLLLLDWARTRITMRALNAALRIARNPFHRMYSVDEASRLVQRSGFRVAATERRAITWMWELMRIDAVAD